MDQKFNISDILEAVNELNNSKLANNFKKKIDQRSKKISNDDIPPSTLKLIEEAEKNIKTK